MMILLNNLLRLVMHINLMLLVRSRRFQNCTEIIENRESCLTYYMSQSKKANFMTNVGLCNAMKAAMFRPFNFANLSGLSSIHTNPVWIGAKQEGDGYYRWMSDGEGMFENYNGETDTLWKGGNTPTFVLSKKCLIFDAGKLDPWDCADDSKANTVCEKCIASDLVSQCSNKLCLCPNLTETVECMADCTTTKGCEELKRYSPPRCQVLGCTTNTFGPNCQFTCNCKGENTACESSDGSCPGGACRDGWSGKSCNLTRCDAGKWGPDCKKNCFCRNMQPCDEKSGYCSIGCLDSLGGLKCTVDSNKTCKGKTFGPKCLQKCHCAINSTCRNNGVCLESALCEPNYAGPACNLGLCPPGKWGHRCQYYCACANGLPCDKKGACPAGCKYPGVTGPSCNNTGCPLGKWGSKCDKNCTCKIGNFCFGKRSQICEDDFVPHYKMCSDEDKKYGPEGHECAFNCNATCKLCDPNSGGSKCVKECPAFPGTYIPDDDLCICDENCVDCDPEGICLECKLMYELNGAICVFALWLLIAGAVAVLLIAAGVSVFVSMEPKKAREIIEQEAGKNEEHAENEEKQDNQERDSEENDDEDDGSQDDVDEGSDDKTESSKPDTDDATE